MVVLEEGKRIAEECAGYRVMSEVDLSTLTGGSCRWCDRRIYTTPLSRSFMVQPQ